MSEYQDITGIKLAQAELTTDYEVIYTSPTDTRTYIKDITVINTSGGSKRIYINVVPAEATTISANAIFYNTLLPAYTTVQWTGVQILNPQAQVNPRVA